MAARRNHDIDAETGALFRLPLSEFTAARNALAARLKKEGRALDAERVKSLARPSPPAWAVNQLYWQDAKAIDRLIAVADRARQAQTGQTPNRDLREILGERKRMMAGLMEDAAAILRAAGHAASPDTMRRVSATLEAIAIRGHGEDGPKAGRLTADLDPPGFDALAGMMSGTKVNSANVLPFRSPKRVDDGVAVRAREALLAAEKLLRETTRDAERAQTALSKAIARAAALDKEREELEARCSQAKEDARKAAQAVVDAERALARAKAALKQV